MTTRHKILIVSRKMQLRAKLNSVEFFFHLLDPAFQKYNGKKIWLPNRMAAFLKRVSNGRRYKDLIIPYTSASVQEELWGILAAIRQRPDVVVYPYADFNYYLFSFLRRWLRCKVVLYSYFSIEELQYRFHHLAHFRRSDLILVTSQEVRDFLRGHFAKKGPRIEILPLGTNTDYFRPIPKKAGPEKRILVAGANRRDHAVTQALITHFGKHHPEVCFEIVGNLTIRTFAESQHNVVFHGYLDDEAMMAAYARCEIGILPLVHAASSNSLNEYISCCLPFVYSRFSGMSELELERFGLPVAPGDTAAFIEAVERLYFDDALIERFKAHCLEEREKLSWTPKVQAFWDMVDTL